MVGAVREGVGGVLVMDLRHLWATAETLAKLVGHSGVPPVRDARETAEALCTALWPGGRLELVPGRMACSEVVLRGVAGVPGWSVVVLPGEDGWAVAARELEQRARRCVLHLRDEVVRLEKALLGLGLAV